MLSWLKPFLKLHIIVLYTILLNKINKFYLKLLWFQIPDILGSFTHYETNDRPNFVLRNLHTLMSHSKVKNVGAYKQSMLRHFMKGKSKKTTFALNSRINDKELILHLINTKLPRKEVKTHPPFESQINFLNEIQGFFALSTSNMSH